MKNDFHIFIKNNSNYVDIQFDLTKILKKNSIDEKDSDVIHNLLHNNIKQLHPFGFEPILKRIDLRYDIIIPSEERIIFWQLMTKTSKMSGKLHKIYGDLVTDKSLYYKRIDAGGNQENIRINVYDKESQLISNDREISNDEKSIIRFEIQLFNKHLNYQKYTYCVDKELEYYLSEKCRIEYFNRYLLPIIFSGTYYNIKIAKKIIYSSDYKESMKAKLIKLLEKCSKFNIDETKKKYSSNTWTKYIGILSSLDINPITIPKESSITIMKNLLSYDANNPIFK